MTELHIPSTVRLRGHCGAFNSGWLSPIPLRHLSSIGHRSVTDYKISICQRTYSFPSSSYFRRGSRAFNAPALQPECVAGDQHDKWRCPFPNVGTGSQHGPGRAYCQCASVFDSDQSTLDYTAKKNLGEVASRTTSTARAPMSSTARAAYDTHSWTTSGDAISVACQPRHPALARPVL